MNRATVVGVLAATAAMLLVGSSVAAASLLTDYPVLAGQAGRYALAAMLLFGGARLVGHPLPRPTKVELAWLAAVALVGMAGFNVLLIAATDLAAPSLVGAIVGTAPIVLAVAGALQQRRPPSVGVTGGAVVVTIGAVLVHQAQLVASPLGVLLAGGAMLGEVGFSLLAVPVLRRLGPTAVSAYACLLAALLLGAGSIVVEGAGALVVPTVVEAASLLYLATAVTALAFVLWYAALGQLGADTAGLFAGLVPVSALFTASAIRTDALAPTSILGVLIVAVGVSVGLSTRGSRPTATAASHAPDA